MSSGIAASDNVLHIVYTYYLLIPLPLPATPLKLSLDPAFMLII